MEQPFDIPRLRVLLGTPAAPISQSELARQLGVHQACVCRWENHKSRPPRTAIIVMEMLRERRLAELRRPKYRRRPEQLRLMA